MSKEDQIQKLEDKISRLSKEIYNKNKEIIYTIKQIAKLKNEKVFVGPCTYDVDFVDYYIAKSVEDIEHADSYLSLIFNYGDGDYQDNEIRELKDEETIVEF